MRVRLQRAGRALLRFTYHQRVLLMVVAGFFLGSALIDTFRGVEVSGSPYRRSYGIHCGSPVRPKPYEDLPADQYDPGGPFLSCIESLDAARSDRTQDLAIGSGVAAAVLAMYLIAGRDVRRLDPPLRVPPLPDLGDVETDRLVVRRARPTDLHPYLQTIDEEVLEVNGWTPEVLAGVALLVSKDQPRFEAHQDLVIVERDTGTLVGAVTVSVPSEPDAPVTLGWWIAAGARGKGYATEAVASIAAALSAAGRPRCGFGTAESNVAIQRVAEKLGAREVTREPVTLPSGRVDPGIVFLLGPPAAE